MPVMQTTGLSSQSVQYSGFRNTFVPRTASFENRGGGHAINRDLHSLASAIQSGNTSAAQSSLNRIEALVPSSATSNTRLGQFLSSVTSALSSNDIAGAQTALSTFEDRRGSGPVTAPTASTPPTTTPTPAPAPVPTGSTAPTSSGLGQDVLNLFTAIGSGSLRHAQSAYDTVTSLLLSGSIATPSTSTGSSPTTTPSAASTTSTSTTTPTTPAATPPSPAFLSLLSQIGSALSTGDIGSAQTAVDNFLQGIAGGSLIAVTA
jgi:hypothetical protein